jgi:aerobic carbon-monoxide dehydrogenase small subunit
VKQPVKFELNGEAADIEVEPRDTLLDVVRTQFGLTGAHAGCEHGACGACTVQFDGTPVRACLMFAVQCEGHRVQTVEAFGTPDALHPVQEAFRAHHALQCGFCTPAMVLTAIDLLERNPRATEAEVREAISGNLCRCTGYGPIVEAICSLTDP